MSKKLILFISVLIIVVTIFTINDYKKKENLISSVDEISNTKLVDVQNYQTKEILFSYDENENDFSEIRNNTYQDYHNFSFFEKVRLHNLSPKYEIIYKNDNDHAFFKIQVYIINEENISLIPDDIYFPLKTVHFKYPSAEHNGFYVFILEEYKQIIGITSEMEKILNNIENQFD